MKDSDSNKLLIFLLAALAIYFPLSSIPSPPDQQSSGQQQLPSFIQIPPHESPTPAPTPLEGRVPGEAAKLLCDFFGLQPDLDQHGQGRNSGEEQTQPNAIQNFDSKKLKCDYCGIKAILNSSKREHPAVADYKNNIEYLIATVPDPKDSRLDHMFDRYLDVIERAIERADYTFDSYWLPWDRSKAPATIVLSSDTKTPQMATATRHLYEPGVILFRYNERPSRASNSDNEGPSLASNSDNEGPSRASNSDNNEPSSGRNKLLLLFLVGESPTGGIHRGAFKNALLQIEEIAGWRKSKTERADKEAAEKESRIMTQFLSGSETEKADEKAADKELRVISPCFSGSEESLVILLKEWIHKYQKPPRVRIISGTVTSMDKCHFLGRIGSDNVSFYSTVVESRQVTEKFYDYLRDLDSSIDRSGDGPRIALLSDAITTSGQRARNPLSDAIMTSGQRAREPQCENRHTADGARPRQPRDLDLTFPLHISQLRVEASKRANLREDPTNVLAVKEPDLELPMREAGSPVSKDIVPLFSPVETVTMDLTLDEMLSAIHREGIRYVGVRAIDVQDRIYLVREIRKHCPNAMIFIYNNDLLYLHSDSNLDFRGALVISTYPIFGLNQLWTYPFKGDRRRLQFSTQNTQGLYNATLALLDKKDRMLEYGLPFHIYQKGDQRYPAIWLGIVGSDGIWPVKTFDPFPDKKPSEKYSYTLLIPSNSSGADVPTDVKEPPSGLGLNRIYWSPTGNGTLLLIGTIFLLLAFVYLAQLSFFRGRSQTDQADSAQPRPLPWIRRGLLGKVFGDEDFFCYCQDRRINLMSSFVCLLVITLFILSVAMLPACAEKKFTNGVLLNSLWDRYLLLGPLLVLTLSAFFLLASGIFGWAIRGMNHLRGHIGAWLALIVAGIITFVCRWDRHPPFGALVGTIFLTLLAFFLMAAGIFGWVIRRRRHLRGYVGAWLALIVGLGMIMFVNWWDRRLPFGALARTILALTLLALFWLASGIFGWVIRRRRRLRGYIGAWLALIVAGIITFICWWDRHPPFVGETGTILGLALLIFFGVASGIFGWAIRRRRHLRRYIGAWLALIVGLGMIAFVSWWYRNPPLDGRDGKILVLTLWVFFWLASGIFGWEIRWGRRLRGHLGAWLALIVGALMITLLGVGLIKIFSDEHYEQIFFFLRATEVRSGVSILLPVLLVGLAAFLSFFTAAQRLKLAEGMPCLRKPQQRPGDAPQFLRFEHEDTKSFKGLKALEDEVKELIVCPIFKVRGAWTVTVVILIVYCFLFVWRFIPSVDGQGFDWFFILGFYIVPLLLVLALMRFFWLGWALKRLLRHLLWHPLISQYAANSEDKRFKLLQPVDLMTTTSTFTALSFSVRQARSLYCALKLSPKQAKKAEQIKQLVDDAEGKLSKAIQARAKGVWQEAMKKRLESQTAIAKLTELVAGLLEKSWGTADGAATNAAATNAGQRSSSKSPWNSWQDEGKFFLITHIVAFLQHIFAQMRNLILWVTIGLLLLLVAATSYPFRPLKPLMFFSWVGILTSVGVALFIFVKLNRDKTLSILARTTPGKLNITPEFAMRVAVVGVLPVIALLGAQFPEAVTRIFSWLSGFTGRGH